MSWIIIKRKTFPMVRWQPIRTTRDWSPPYAKRNATIYALENVFHSSHRASCLKCITNELVRYVCIIEGGNFRIVTCNHWSLCCFILHYISRHTVLHTFCQYCFYNHSFKIWAKQDKARTCCLSVILCWNLGHYFILQHLLFLVSYCCMHGGVGNRRGCHTEEWGLNPLNLF